MASLLAPPRFQSVLILLRAWKLWFLGAILGGLIGLGVYAIFPPPVVARATVMVDFNVEESWPQAADREIFYYLERESRKLQEIAWSDDTLQAVSAQTGLSPLVLRQQTLSLSQPADGGWHFYARSGDPQQARQAASAWALAFSQQAQIQRPQFDSRLQILPTQTQNLPVAPAISRGAYALAGAGFSLAALALVVLLWPIGKP